MKSWNKRATSTRWLQVQSTLYSIIYIHATHTDEIFKVTIVLSLTIDKLKTSHLASTSISRTEIIQELLARETKVASLTNATIWATVLSLEYSAASRAKYLRDSVFSCFLPVFKRHLKCHHSFTRDVNSGFVVPLLGCAKNSKSWTVPSSYY